jgi:integrating conjugative element protein (TIGR03761 family)
MAVKISEIEHNNTEDTMKTLAEEMVKEKKEKLDTVKTDDADHPARGTVIKQRERVSARVAVKPWNVAGRSDALVGPGIAAMNPGAMQMSAKVNLHSRLSINLFRGRQGDLTKNIRPIIGLARFARQSAMVWSAAALDDPYADQTLVHIETAYELAKATIDSKKESLQRLLEGMEDFEITLQESMQPVTLELNFFSPWGFRGATLLSQFDQLVRMALTARHLGIFAEGDWESVVHESQRAIRHLFVAVDRWVPTGVKRADIRDDTLLAARAHEKYRELKKNVVALDEALLSGQGRALLSPANWILDAYVAEAANSKQKLLRTVTKSDDADVNKNGTVDAEHVINEAVKKPTFGFATAKKISRDAPIARYVDTDAVK